MSWGKHRKVATIEKRKLQILHGHESIVTFYFTKYDLMIVQDLWQLHYQILLTFSQNEFTKLNGKIVIVSLNMRVSRII